MQARLPVAFSTSLRMNVLSKFSCSFSNSFICFLRGRRGFNSPSAAASGCDISCSDSVDCSMTGAVELETAVSSPFVATFSFKPSFSFNLFIESSFSVFNMSRTRLKSIEELSAACDAGGAAMIGCCSGV